MTMHLKLSILTALLALLQPQHVNGYTMLDEISELTNYVLDEIIHKKSEPYDFLSGDILSVETAFYFLGYVICAALGVLSILVVTLGGFITCCCRCCCAKNTKERRKERKNYDCRSNCCGFFMFLFCALAASACAGVFLMEQPLTDKHEYEEIAASLEGVDSYVETTYTEIENLTRGGFQDISDGLMGTLEELPYDAMQYIDKETGILTNFEEFENKIAESRYIVTDYYKNEEKMKALNVKNEELSDDLSALASDIKSICTEPECLDVITLANSISTKIDYEIPLDIDTLNESISTISEIIDKGSSEVSDIETSIEGEISGCKTDLKGVLDEIQNEIDTQLTNAKESIDNFNVTDILNNIRNFWQEGWPTLSLVVYGIGGLFTLILFFLVVGLLFGCCCARPKTQSQCCTRATGSTCILAGLGFFFIFYWLVAILTLGWFLVGGLMHTDVCRYALHPNETTLIDDIVYKYVYPDGHPINITVSDIYTQCGNDKSIYKALDLSSYPDYDLDNLVDISKVEEQIESIKDITFDISNIDISIDEVKDGIDAIDDLVNEIITRVTDELGKDVVQPSLNKLITDLTDLQGQITIDLTSQIENAKALDDTIDAMTNKNAQLYINFNGSENSWDDINLSESVNSLNGSVNLLNDNGAEISGKFVNETADKLLDTTVNSITGITDAIKNDVGKCMPVYESYNGAVGAVCRTWLYPLNSLWMCMAVFLVAMIPVIFIGFSLADMYRKTIPYSRSKTEPFTPELELNAKRPVYVVEDRPHRYATPEELRNARPPPYSPEKRY